MWEEDEFFFEMSWRIDPDGPASVSADDTEDAYDTEDADLGSLPNAWVWPEGPQTKEQAE